MGQSFYRKDSDQLDSTISRSKIAMRCLGIAGLTLSLTSCSQLPSKNQDFKGPNLRPLGPYDSLYMECSSASQLNQYVKAFEICQADLTAIIGNSGSDVLGYPIYEQLGGNAFISHNPELAMSYFTKSIQYARASKDEWSAIRVLHLRAVVLRSLGQYSLAQNDLDGTASRVLDAFNYENEKQKKKDQLKSIDRLKLIMAINAQYSLLSEYARICMAQSNYECAITKANAAQAVYQEGFNTLDREMSEIIKAANESIGPK